ncbi:MAG TPA: alpha/beta fold hydrolase [Stellaceae bacterium]
MALFAGIALRQNALGQAAPAAAFAQRPCELSNVSPEGAARIRCGTVSVPRNYNNIGAGWFKLAVVVIKSAQQPSLPDPVVYISGGPGGPLTVYAGYQAKHPYAPRRDLILVDQRGTGRSEPKLCPDLYHKLVDADIAVAEDATPVTLARRRKVFAACRDEATGRGFDLGDFGTRVTVEDFERVRHALGVERWNVYGESYGTTVAMTLAASHPQHVRSVVLDSVFPPDPMPLRSAVAGGALDAFFAYCAQQRGCSAFFPNLKRTYRKTLDRLRRAPLEVTVPPDGQIRLTASSFEALIYNLLFYPPNYPGMPRLIATAHDRETEDLGPVIASVIRDFRQQDPALYAAVECRDRPHLRSPLPNNADSYDREHLNAVCNEWSSLGAPPLLPANISVPVLVLEGQFDPVAGPALARRVAETIGKKARFVEFPLIGHNVRAFSRCGAEIASEFIDRPEEAPDTSCVGRIPPIGFLPRYPPP